MKLRELVEKTDVSTETIQFYLREGSIPKPRKRGGPRQAMVSTMSN